MVARTGSARPSRSRPWRRLAALAGVGALGLATACSSGGGTGTATRRFSAYRQCLQQHGVTPRRGRGSTTTGPAATGSGAGPGAAAPAGASTTTRNTTAAEAQAFEAARAACRKLRPAGGLRGGGIAGKKRSEFRKCMADHGVALPTTTSRPPGTTGPGGTVAAPAPRGGMLAGLDRNDPTVAAALTACRTLLGAPRKSTTTTGG
ncbi:MAG TPA: hypothetical protein VHL53_17945 [Acidimicrobiia bacterium]|nr:hypothetical protein [Acidimicrobiia bacterium]